MDTSNELSDYLDFGIYDSDPIPEPISPATLAMSPFSSIATVASNTFGDDPVAGFSADQLLDFPMCSAAANDGGFPGTSFSPFALTAPFPEFTDAQDHGAQSTLMQSHRDPQMTAPMLSMSADVDIAALLRQYDKGSVTDPVKSSVPPAVVEPLVAVKQEPMDDVLMSVNDIPATRSSGISPAALFGSTAAPIINRPTGTASNSAQDFFPLHPTLHRSASSASMSASASEEEDDAHEAVTPDPFAGSKDHQVDVVTAASTGGSRKSSVVATPAITGKRGRATDSDSVNDKVKVKGKTSNTPPIDFASYAREPTPVRELTAMDVLDDTDGGGFDGSSSSRINIDTLKPLPLPSMFGGIKGKGGKKGGGLSSVVLEDPAEAGEDDDWRPTPEEYKKLSSKEKRQLRNKLSARAFRTRRKTYINELEDHIKDRDRLIDAIKGELMTSRSENDELKREIDALKRAAMAPVPSSLKEMTPAPTSALVAGLGLTTSHSNNTGKTPSSSTINTYNPRKDVSGSTSAALSAMSPKFWGATSGSAGGGYTTCHTTFVPDLVFPGASGAMSPPSLSSSSYTSAYSSPAASTTSSASPYLFARANLNPLLNDPANKSSTAMEPTSPVTSSISLSTPTDGSDLSDSFGNWSAQNGFTWNNLDAYRMQLWSRMARDASYARQGVPVEMRPKFLREQHPKSPPSSSLSIGLNEALSPVGTTYPAAPPTYRESHDDPVPSITQIIQHTISTRLFSSFLNALKAPPATAGNGTGGRLDPEKIADIASGKARLGVLPSEPPAYSEKHRAAADAFDVEAEQALAMSFTNLKLATESIARSKSAALTTGPR